MSWIEIAALVMAVVALRRSRAAQTLAARVSRLEKEMEGLRRGARRAGAAGALEQSAADAEVWSAAAVEAGGIDDVLPAPSAPAPPSRWWARRRAGADSREADQLVELFSPAQRRAAMPLRIEWEQWVGVRGAAVLGGIVLALAGIFFFRYSIEHGLLPPWLRVVLGTVVGVGCLVAAERYLRREYSGTANSLVGAGVVILYAAFWSAHGLYALVGAPLSFLLMALVTATCAAFSWRQNSLVIALIGLVGGFLTPLLLSSGSDRPIGLFSYVFLLDVGLLYLARQRRWAVLALVSFAATAFYLAAWTALRMGPQRVPLGLFLVAVFAAMFVLVPQPGDDRRRHWWLTRVGGALLPFAFGAHFAADARLGAHLYPLAISLLPLGAAACWLSRVHRRWELGLAAAGASLGVVAMWLLTRHLDTGLAWEVALLSAALAIVFHVFVELDRDRSGWEGPSLAAVVACFGGFALLAGAALEHDHIAAWPWLFAWLALTLVAMRHGALAARGYLQPLAAVALALALTSTQLHATRAFPGVSTYLALALAIACAFQAFAVRPSVFHAGAASEQAAVNFALLAALSLIGMALRSPPSLLPALLTASALGGLAALAATRAAAPSWYAAAMLVTACVHGIWIFARAHEADQSSAVAALLVQLGSALFFTGWPLFTAPRLRRERGTWYAAAFALPAWFLPLRQTFTLLHGSAAIGVLPVALGAFALAAAVRVRSVVAADQPQREHAFVWFIVVALGFAAVAIPLQLSKEWITLGWALEGAAVIWLWRKYDLPALKYFALALLGAATARLILNPAVLGYYPRPSIRIVNWLAYTYLIPAACLLASAAILARLEVPRARSREAALYGRAAPVGAIATGLAGLLAIFFWLNLAIADWFATGPTLTVSFARLPARDLATSVVWAAYALGLLAAGVRLTNSGLRWVSLALLSLTLVKVFLYDLGELRDLYRVASLLGLALSLIAVSLVYQRFVFRRAMEGE